MLGLATHEPNFTIIREEFKPNKPKPCALCNQMGHEVKDCQGLPREKQGKVRILIFLEILLICNQIYVLRSSSYSCCQFCNLSIQIMLLELPGFPFILINKDCSSVAYKYYVEHNFLTCIWFAFFFLLVRESNQSLNRYIKYQDTFLHKNLRTCAYL